VIHIAPDRVTVWDSVSDHTYDITATRVLIAARMQPRRLLADAITGRVRAQVHSIGDAAEPRKLADALLDGARIAHLISRAGRSPPRRTTSPKGLVGAVTGESRSTTHIVQSGREEFPDLSRADVKAASLNSEWHVAVAFPLTFAVGATAGRLAHTPRG
jgi:hypothetical protein